MEGFFLGKKSSGRQTSRSVSTKRRSTTPNGSGREYELIGLTLLAFALISGVGLLGLNVGYVGFFFADLFRYLFGWGAPFAVLIIALISMQYIIHHRGLLYTKKFFGVIGLFVSLLAMWHHFVIPVDEEILPQSLPNGGGLIGGGVLFLLRSCFGVDGATILLSTIIVGSLLLATTWSLASGYFKTKEQAKRGANAAGAALQTTREKVSVAAEKIETKTTAIIHDTLSSVPYNQANDPMFAEQKNKSISLEQKEVLESFAPELKAQSVPNEENEVSETASVRGTCEQFVSEETKILADEKDAASVSFPFDYERELETQENELVIPVEQTPVMMDEHASAKEEGIDDAPQNMDATAPPTVPFVDESGEHPYELPKVTHILSKHSKKENGTLAQEIKENAHVLQQTLESFHVNAKVISFCHGPAVTRYDLEPAPGVKVSKITNLAEDIALQLATSSVRIEPVPGKAAIGIEIPNRTLESVQLREVLENPQFQEASSKLTVGLGMDISGQAIFADIGKMPHLLVAGATGSGKSVCINTLISSILFKATPDEVKFILIDPKMVELSNYNGIPHLMVPVVTDPKKASSVLNWAVQEMEKRYSIFATHGVRDIKSFNRRYPEENIPLIVIVIDELADLMMVSPKDVEDAICRILQKARAAGIHMILATQRPSVNVITGIIKANLPSRISFAVSSQVDSRTILDRGGAETLLGKGDMLFSPQGASKPIRVQGAFISDEEVEMLLDYIRSQGHEISENEELIDFMESETAEDDNAEEDGGQIKYDQLLPDAVEIVMSTGQASTSNIQRRLSVGYTRAARLVDTMEELRIIGASAGGNKPREILMTSEQAKELVKSLI
ncbi:DNA translocase FtsK [Selenomonas noxia]|uniref:FtsK/SpoIIIE family DNA translocase n=1 Tax=Selenomonas noxia TaxID=135083 RepID=UPI00288B234B|nr:DNA translocase FtsK [Selenomonas noxia]